MHFKSEDLADMSLVDLGALLHELKNGVIKSGSVVVEHAIDKRIRELQSESNLDAQTNIDYLFNSIKLNTIPLN